MLWDIFCKVIDNHGDIGVCWRLSAGLASRGEQVRLWVDDPSALAWMAPRAQEGVQVAQWREDTPMPTPGDVAVEAFGCELPAAYQSGLAARTAAQGRQPAWINLEYLTAENFAGRNHGLPSPVMSGPARGLTKHFFYPGFSDKTGGLLREPDLAARQAAFDKGAWLRALGLPDADEARISLFCYEPAALGALLARLADAAQPTRLLVTAGRATTAVQQALEKEKGPQGAWNVRKALSISYLPLLSQEDYDHLLWACDCNFVRGEDSLVRALWAGKPLVWQLYPQQDGAHHAKLAAFLDWLDAPASLRQFHQAWNGAGAGSLPFQPAAWQGCVHAARQALQARPSLVDQLLAFAREGRAR